MTASGQGAGQADIFREVLKQQGLIRAVLRRYGVPDAHADDLVQEVLVIAHRRIQEAAFHPRQGKPLSGAVSAWLIGISRNVAKDFRRSIAMQNWLFAHEGRANLEAPVVPSPEDRLLAKEQLEVMARVKLSAAQREIITLTAMGRTAVEIGAVLGLLPDTVATNLRRVRAVLRKVLKNRGV